jgi:hypothetical protein
MNEDPIPTSPPRARKRGCVLRGCLVIFIVVMLMGVIIGGAGTYIYYGFAPFLKQEPAPIRIYPATDAEYQAVLAKVAPFSRALEAGIEAPLEITAQELDILIARDPAWAELRGKLYLNIVNNELIADVSTPADEEENAQVQLFFNARLYLRASIAGGEFTAVMRRVETLSGQPLPSVLARCAASPGFAQSWDDSINRRIKDNSFLARYLSRLRTATIEKNRILVISAGQHVPPATPAPTASPSPSPISAPTATPVPETLATPRAGGD